MERNSDNDCIGCIELWFVFFLSNRHIISGLLRFQQIIWLSRIYITNSISGLCVEHIKIWSIDVFSLLFRKKNIYEKRCVENCGLRRMVTSLRQLSYVLICMVQEALVCLNIFILGFLSYHCLSLILVWQSNKLHQSSITWNYLTIQIILQNDTQSYRY